MSRSYKKTPWCGDTKTVGKKLANRRVRRGKYRDYDFPDGSSYKKAYCQYDICDFGNFETWRHFLIYARNPNWPWCRPDERTDEELYRAWYKYYRSK